MELWLALVVGLLGAVGGAILSAPLRKYLRRAAAVRAHATRQLAPGIRLRQQALAFLGLALVFGIVFGSPNLPAYLRLARHGRATGATVVEPECANHATFRYRFMVGDRIFTGRGGATSVGVACERLRPGDQVVTYYVPWDPETNARGHVGQALINEIISVVLTATVFPFFLVVLLRSRGLL